MRRLRKGDNDAPGADSFLDIVANLVGILIILVMVIGVRARDAVVDAHRDAPSPAEALEPIDVETPRQAARAVHNHIHRIDQEIERVASETALRRQERNALQTIALAAQEELEKLKSRLDQRQRRDFEVNQKLAAAQKELAELKRRRQAAEDAASPVGVIEHLPTPMAQTVLGREEHFRLREGRLAYVPWQELVDKLKDEARRKVWKLKESPRITETIGPEGGFLMRYTLVRKKFVTPTKVGAMVREGVELDRFVLTPVAENLGEPLEQAFQPGSQFSARLSQYDPQRTTITVWVYPDSYAEFRTLKQELFRRGFLAAARPLPKDLPIGGSPEGTRSASQ